MKSCPTPKRGNCMMITERRELKTEDHQEEVALEAYSIFSQEEEENRVVPEKERLNLSNSRSL